MQTVLNRKIQNDNSKHLNELKKASQINRVEAFLCKLLTDYKGYVSISSYRMRDEVRHYIKRKDGSRVVYIGIKDGARIDLGTYKAGYSLESYEIMNLDLYNMATVKSVTAVKTYLKRYL